MRLIKSIHNNAKLIVVVGVVVGCVLLIPGYSNTAESGKVLPKDEGEKSAVIARVGEHAITVADFERYLSDRPVSARSPSLKEDVAKRLNALILEKVLYQEALRLKLDQDPDIRQMLNQKLIDEQINQKEWNREISEEELQAYYDKHQHEFNRPAQVRVADIFIAASADATDGTKVELKKRRKPF
jgi:hypothetical protein